MRLRAESLAVTSNATPCRRNPSSTGSGRHVTTAVLIGVSTGNRPIRAAWALADVVAAAIAILIFGFSLGAELDIVAYLTSRYFGRENFGFLFGTIGGCLGFASGNGPVLLNRVYDVAGSYTPALWAAVPLCLLSAGLFLCLGRYPEGEQQQRH